MYFTRLLPAFAAFETFATFGNCIPAPAPCDCNLQSDNNLHVEIGTGTLMGFINSSAPSVRQFLGVPYSLPPIGVRRWLPPSKLQKSGSMIATSIGPVCSQLLLTDQHPVNTSVFAPGAGNQTEFFPLQANFSEDCLTLNVWTPRNRKNLLPVIVWFFGGGFTQGGTNSLYFNPQSWVQRTQEHIVVTVNFRSNIFGFPNAAGLGDQNLGLLDQRLALEWVRDNIAHFGGDPSRIISWGESAGAIAVDYIDFAYPLDPIVSGRIMASGTAFFKAVAKAHGCGSASSQVECLRNVFWQEIERHLATAEGQTFTFLPIADEKLVFSNYSQRYEMDALSSIPAIVGTNQHELIALAVDNAAIKYNNILSPLTNSSFLCTAAATSRLREATCRTTYRYRYDGNFSNISPGIYTGAYHASELPLIFGTAGEYHGESAADEELVSRKLQDLWLAFAKYPEEGLKNAGWNSYGAGKALLIGSGNSTIKEINVSRLDYVCNI